MPKQEEGKDQSFEHRKWEREAAFREREVSVKEREIALRDAELALKRDEQAAAGWRSPLIVAIMAATLAGLSNAVITVVNGRLQRQLEDGRAEQTRVLEMIKTGDADKAAGNLQFLLDAGLIADPERATMLKEFLARRVPGSGPALPPQTTAGPYLGGITGFDDAVPVDALPQSPIRKAASSVGQIRGFQNDGTATVCTGFLVAPDLALTARHCVEGLKTAELVLREGKTETAYSVTLPPVEISSISDGPSYSVIKLQGSPGAKHGTLRLSTSAPSVGQMLAIVFFRTSNQQLAIVGSADCKVRLVDNEMFYHLCDTGGGSSGAPILSATGGDVIGMHFSRSDKGGVATRSDILVRNIKTLQARR